jgi:hypothetical protein
LWQAAILEMVAKSHTASVVLIFSVSPGFALASGHWS